MGSRCLFTLKQIFRYISDDFSTIYLPILTKGFFFHYQVLYFLKTFLFKTYQSLKRGTLQSAYLVSFAIYFTNSFGRNFLQAQLYFNSCAFLIWNVSSKIKFQVYTSFYNRLNWKSFMYLQRLFIIVIHRRTQLVCHFAHFNWVPFYSLPCLFANLNCVLFLLTRNFIFVVLFLQRKNFYEVLPSDTPLWSHHALPIV